VLQKHQQVLEKAAQTQTGKNYAKWKVLNKAGVYLMGNNRTIVWCKFSALSLAVLLQMGSHF